MAPIDTDPHVDPGDAMELYGFSGDQLLTGPEAAPNADLLWIDAQRTDSHWADAVGDLLGIDLHARHLSDLRNERHPPFFDAGDDYDLLVVRTADPNSPPEAPATNPVAFVVTSRVVVSVRPPGDKLFDGLRDRLLAGTRRQPDSVGMLLHLLLNQVGDALLELRQPMSEKLAELQRRLLDASDPFSDWHVLMEMRSHISWLQTNLEVQRDVLARWREETVLVSLDQPLRVRFNDLDDHLARVERHTAIMRSDIDSLVQVNFAANSDRTNRVVQLLTVVSAVFLPLNLVAGIFGMNFSAVPLTDAPFGFWLTLALMTALGLALLLWVRARRWL
jgi:magnesium/cobalt transport protein CorA